MGKHREEEERGVVSTKGSLQGSAMGEGAASNMVVVRWLAVFAGWGGEDGVGDYSVQARIFKRERCWCP